MTESRQSRHLRESDLRSLRSLIPEGCPLSVTREEGDYRVHTSEGDIVALATRGRFQIAAAYIQGYVAAWRTR